MLILRRFRGVLTVGQAVAFHSYYLTSKIELPHLVIEALLGNLKHPSTGRESGWFRVTARWSHFPGELSPWAKPQNTTDLLRKTFLAFTTSFRLGFGHVWFVPRIFSSVRQGHVTAALCRKRSRSSEVFHCFWCMSEQWSLSRTVTRFFHCFVCMAEFSIVSCVCRNNHHCHVSVKVTDASLTPILRSSCGRGTDRQTGFVWTGGWSRYF